MVTLRFDGHNVTIKLVFIILFLYQTVIY